MIKIVNQKLDEAYNVLFRFIESDNPSNPTEGTKKIKKVLDKIDEIQNEIDNLNLNL
jgi:hypothetical protein|tara:strand:- start:16 stop:186 length:171 start_codon:yes stop_codon:yes gene_type:complete